MQVRFCTEEFHESLAKETLLRLDRARVNLEFRVI